MLLFCYLRYSGYATCVEPLLLQVQLFAPVLLLEPLVLHYVVTQPVASDVYLLSLLTRGSVCAGLLVKSNGIYNLFYAKWQSKKSIKKNQKVNRKIESTVPFKQKQNWDSRSVLKRNVHAAGAQRKHWPKTSDSSFIWNIRSTSRCRPRQIAHFPTDILHR